MESAPPDEILTCVLAAFGLGPLREQHAMGGTASRKWSVLTPEGRFVIRSRPAEFAAKRLWQFDHAVLRRLAAAGLPVPEPMVRPDGSTAVSIEGVIYEVLRWVDGGPFLPERPEAHANLGRFLAQFHAALIGDAAPGKEGDLREDHPDLLEPYLADLRRQNPAAGFDWDALGQELDKVRMYLDGELYTRLPRAIIHGDFHPGNVRFRGPEVAALYDFDYLSVQARVRDLTDAILFFASHRQSPLDPDDIRSLTQPMVPDAALAERLLAGYAERSPLLPIERQAIPWLIRSRWLQMRLRGARKIPAAEKAAFVLDRFWNVIDWLDGPGRGFLR